MNQTFRILLAALAWIPTGFSSALAEAPPIRILPIGDSITSGTTPGGYRGTLYNLLSVEGYNVDYVGTSISNSETLAEKEHEGHSNSRIDEIDSNLPTWLSEINDPDIILLHIGTNDFTQNFATPTAIERLDALVLKMASLRPAANIIVTNLMEREEPSNAAIVAQYNPFIQARVAAHVAAGRKVTFLDMRSAVPLSDMPDLLHPDEVGYNKMAGAWLAAIQVIITPEGDQSPPAISRVSGNVLRNRISITFTKPVADNSATLANFAVSGGLTLSNPELDASKRVVTLSTSSQTPETNYTVTVNHVTDRIAPVPQVIAANSTGNFTASLTSSTNLLHRYSFNTNGAVEDSAGGNGTAVNGTLAGAATVTGGSLVTHGEANGTAYASIPGAATAGITGSFSIQQFATPAFSAGFYQTLSIFTQPGPDNNGGTQRNILISTPVRYENNFPSGFGYWQPGVNGGNQKLVLGPPGDADGTEHVFTTTFDATTGVAKYYLDGILHASSEPGSLAGFNLSVLSNIGINGRPPFNDASLTGSTNEFRIYQGALTMAQVQGTSLNPNLTAAEFAELGVAIPGLATSEPPKVQSYSLNVAAGTLDMTFSSNAGTIYQTMQSTDLIVWTPVGPEIQGQATQTRVQITFSSAPAKFFRVQPMP